MYTLLIAQLMINHLSNEHIHVHVLYFTCVLLYMYMFMFMYLEHKKSELVVLSQVN